MMKNKKLIIVICAVILSLVTVVYGIYYFTVVLPDQKRRNEAIKQAQEYYDTKLTTFEQENATLSNVQVAFIGDSLTDGYNLSTYYPQYTTVNRGIAGDTTFGLEDRLQISLFDISPQVVVMLIGGNNYKTMFDNYESILQKIKTNLPSSHVILLSLTALGGNYARLNNIFQQNNVRIQSLAEQYGFEYIDLFGPLCDEESGEIYPQYTTDSVHLTAQGYQVLTNCITPALEALLV